MIPEWTEEWRTVYWIETIPPGRYHVTPSGAVSGPRKLLQPLTPSPNTRYAYPHVFLYGRKPDGSRSRKAVGIHQLVARAFLGPPPPGKPLVLHKDGDPTNYHLSNLHYGSHQENMTEFLRNGTRTTLSEPTVLQIRALFRRHKMSLDDLSRLFKVQKATIHEIVHYKAWKHLP